jgi:hypothetical protein
MAGRLALIRINSVAQSDSHLIWRLLERLSLHAMLPISLGRTPMTVACPLAMRFAAQGHYYCLI